MTGVTPAPGTWVESVSAITLEYSQPLGARGLDGVGIEVRDGSGRPVRGDLELTADRRSIVFRLASSLATGAYAVALSGRAKDEFGRSAPVGGFASYSFEVRAGSGSLLGPTVLGEATPASTAIATAGPLATVSWQQDAQIWVADFDGARWQSAQAVHQVEGRDLLEPVQSALDAGTRVHAVLVGRNTIPVQGRADLLVARDRDARGALRWSAMSIVDQPGRLLRQPRVHVAGHVVHTMQTIQHPAGETIVEAGRMGPEGRYDSEVLFRGPAVTGVAWDFDGLGGRLVAATVARIGPETSVYYDSAQASRVTTPLPGMGQVREVRAGFGGNFVAVGRAEDQTTDVMYQMRGRELSRAIVLPRDSKTIISTQLEVVAVGRRATPQPRLMWVLVDAAGVVQMGEVGAALAPDAALHVFGDPRQRVVIAYWRDGAVRMRELTRLGEGRVSLSTESFWFDRHARIPLERTQVRDGGATGSAMLWVEANGFQLSRYRLDVGASIPLALPREMVEFSMAISSSGQVVVVGHDLDELQALILR